MSWSTVFTLLCHIYQQLLSTYHVSPVLFFSRVITLKILLLVDLATLVVTGGTTGGRKNALSSLSEIKQNNAHIRNIMSSLEKQQHQSFQQKPQNNICFHPSPPGNYSYNIRKGGSLVTVLLSDNVCVETRSVHSSFPVLQLYVKSVRRSTIAEMKEVWSLKKNVSSKCHS